MSASSTLDLSPPALLRSSEPAAEGEDALGKWSSNAGPASLCIPANGGPADATKPGSPASGGVGDDDANESFRLLFRLGLLISLSPFLSGDLERVLSGSNRRAGRGPLPSGLAVPLLDMMLWRRPLLFYWVWILIDDD